MTINLYNQEITPLSADPVWVSAVADWSLRDEPGNLRYHHIDRGSIVISSCLDSDENQAPVTDEIIDLTLEAFYKDL